MADLNMDYDADGSETVVNCGRGWLLVQSKEDGLYYPFFLKVREDDIVWDMSRPTEEFDSIRNQFIVDSEKMYRPGSKYVMTGRANNERYGSVESWVVTVYKDLTAEFQKRIILDQRVCVIDDDSQNRRMTINVKLPFKISASDMRNFSINVTKNMNVDSVSDGLLTSVVNTRMVEEYDASDVNKENPFYSNVSIDLISLGESFESISLPYSYAQNKLMKFPYSIYFSMSGKIFEVNENTELFESYTNDFSKKQ